MAPKRELLLIFLLSCFFSVYSEDFDYFWHVQQWPPSVCTAGNKSCAPLERFVIYGFWPEYDNGSYPIDCKGPSYNSNAIAAERAQLDKYWINLYGGENDVVWQYAWRRHGVCSASQFDQTEYFATALKIRTSSKYNLYDMLKEDGITPSFQRVLPKAVVRSVIATKVGKKPGLRCQKNVVNDRDQLTRIILCFERDGVTPRDCPSSADKGCPEYFYWPGTIFYASTDH